MLNIIRNKGYNAHFIRSMDEIISKNKAVLKKMKMGHSMRDENFVFYVIQTKGNIVIKLLEKNNKEEFVIKWPIVDINRNIFWETEQWEYLTIILDNHAHAAMPSFIAFNDDSKVLILEKLIGRSAYQMMKLLPFKQIVFWNKPSIVENFFKLGKVIADLHNKGKYNIRSPFMKSLSERLNSISERALSDKTFFEGLKHFNKHYRNNNNNFCWIHGNLRGDNIIFNSRGIALIDLERSGAGSSMEDLGRLLAFILMFRKLRLFPKYYWESIITAIIEGYASSNKIDMEELLLAILGEILFVYGRDFVIKDISTIRSAFRYNTEKILKNLLRLTKVDPMQIINYPSMLVY